MHALEQKRDELKRFVKEYVDLQTLLQTLPNRTRHEVMVPFSPFVLCMSVSYVVQFLPTLIPRATESAPLTSCVCRQRASSMRRVGFMPGQLRHTNEVLVALGFVDCVVSLVCVVVADESSYSGEYFAERSASQACEIIGRRLVYLQVGVGYVAGTLRHH